MSVTTDALTLSWSVSHTSGALEVIYTLKNERRRSIWLLDQVLVRPTGAGPGLCRDRILVRASPDAAVPVTFALGYVPSNSWGEDEVPPGAREVGSGDTISGRAEVPLPLTTWHPDEAVTLAMAGVSRAVLRLGWIDDRPTDVVRMADGALIPVPSLTQRRADQLWIQGPALEF